ncbi:DEP domain-containing protein 4 [Aplochiton taeniatus]
MAVDLTPRFRRLNSHTRSLRENIQPGFSGPFRATHLWQNIIQALQAQVEVRRRRRHLRVHAECFTGADAVDAVLSHLMQNVVFCASEVSRLKATRLCQALMDAKVFEAVGTKLFRRDKDVTFEDSSCSLYRFLDCSALPDSTKKDYGDTQNVSPEKLGKRRKGSRMNELRTISNPLAVGPADRRVERLFKTINLQPSILASSATTQSFLSKAVVQEVWRQQTLLQLLQAVELPILDCILNSPARTQPPQLFGSSRTSTRQDLVYSNTCLDRDLSQTLNLPKLDVWLAAAADCLELFPDQMIVTAGEHLRQQDLSTSEACEAEMLAPQKRLLFDTIAKYYGSQERAPLLNCSYQEVHTAILDLLDGGKVKEAIRASQLYLRLLNASGRDELRRLLAFMALAAQPEACRLQKQIDNRSLVCRTLSKAIVQNQELTRVQCETLVLFLMDSHAQLFKTPVSLIESVRRTLQTMQQGRGPDFITTFTFCQQVTPQEYEDQSEAATLKSLKQLLQDISLNGNLPVKVKKRLVKEFQKHHPVVFLQHFSSTF